MHAAASETVESRRPRRRLLIARLGLSGVFIALALVYVFWQSRLADVLDTAASISVTAIVIGGGALTLSLFLAALRMRYAAHDLGHKLSYRDCLAAAALGGIAGHVAFQIVGQIAARGSVFHRRGSSVEAAAAVTLYERAVATVVSIALAICGAFYLFGLISIDVKAGGDNLLVVVVGISVTFAALICLAWPDLIARYVAPLVGWKNLARTLRIAGMTFLIQGCTLIAFVVLVEQFAPTIVLYKIAAACAIVMFAASLPISFAGWGVRELSAVAALGVIGVAPQVAITASVLVGLLSFAAVASVGTWAAFATFGTAPSAPLSATAPGVEASAQRRAVEIALALLTAALVLFQVQAPLERGWINLSPADLPATICGVLVLFRLVTAGRDGTNALVLFSVLGSALLLIGYLHGYLSFGRSEWAGARTVGWFVLLCYAAAGSVIARAHDIGDVRRLGMTLTISATAIVAFSLIVGLYQPNTPRLVGFSGTANALGFQLVICLVVGFVFLRKDRWWPAPSLALVAGIIATRSLANIGALVITSVTAWMILYRPRRVLVLSIIFGALAVLATSAYFLRGSAQDFGGSNAERWGTIVQAAEIFVSHPIFGAGLGYFYEHFHRANGAALVVHSTPMWLLAEFGLVGALAVTAFGVYLVRLAIRAGDGGLLLILLLIVFTSVGLVHDIFYQRLFWFALGAGIAWASDARKSVTGPSAMAAN